MKRLSFSEKLRFALVEPNYADVGLEFNSDCLRLAVVSAEQGALRIQHLDSEPLPAGAVEISPFKPNILSIEPVAEALRNLWSRNRLKSARLSLLLQDRCALTFHLAMEHPARNQAECIELIRFKLKKNVPFRMEDAQVVYFTPSGTTEHTSLSYWVVALNHAVLQQYEQLVQSAIDTQCGLVDTATLNIMNLAHAESRSRNLLEQDLLYVNLNRDYISLAITQGTKLTSLRTRPLEQNAEQVVSAMDEIHPTAMYYQDKLGGQGFACAFVYSVGHTEGLHSEIESRIGVPVIDLSLDGYSGSRFDSSNPGFLRGFVPLAGLLLSRKVEFA